MDSGPDSALLRFRFHLFFLFVFSCSWSFPPIFPLYLCFQPSSDDDTVSVWLARGLVALQAAHSSFPEGPAALMGTGGSLDPVGLERIC
jgi:hypothetical protein